MVPWLIAIVLGVLQVAGVYVTPGWVYILLLLIPPCVRFMDIATTPKV